MKNTLIKLLCLACSFVVLLTSCSTAIKKEDNDFDIEQEEYIISFGMVGPMLYQKYLFLLTPDNRILAEYVDENHKIHKFQTELNDLQLTHMNQYIEEVLTLKEDDIQGFMGISDFWYCTINFKDVHTTFDYGASKSTAVNLLLEQIIGCCDAEKSLKTAKNLKPAPIFYREFNEMIETGWKDNEPEANR